MATSSPSGSAKGHTEGVAKLTLYWTKGEGALKIKWGVPGDFKRCVRELSRHVADPEGLCNVYHRLALGVAPGQEDGHRGRHG